MENQNNNNNEEQKEFNRKFFKRVTELEEEEWIPILWGLKN